MSTNPQTPGQVANTWAKAHSEFVGTLMIQSITRKGRAGRRGFANRWNTFLVRDGKTAQSRQKRLDSYSVRSTEGVVPVSRSVDVYVFNGTCSVCGEVYLETILQRAWADDPGAGDAIDISPLSPWPGWKDITAEKAYVRACPTCVAEHSLLIDHERAVGYRLDRDKQTRIHARPHPLLHRVPFAPRLVKLDIRDGEPYQEIEVAANAVECERDWFN